MTADKMSRRHNYDVVVPIFIRHFSRPLHLSCAFTVFFYILCQEWERNNMVWNKIFTLCKNEKKIGSRKKGSEKGDKRKFAKFFLILIWLKRFWNEFSHFFSIFLLILPLFCVNNLLKRFLVILGGLSVSISIILVKIVVEKNKSK